LRVKPAGFVGALGAQWLCAAMDLLLGESDLRHAPALMSGFGSVLDSATASRFASAATALRLLGVAASSEIQLRQLAYSAVGWEEDHRDDPGYREPPYSIDVSDPRLPFRRRVPIDDPDLVAMTAALARPLNLQGWAMGRADPLRPFVIETGPAGTGDRISILRNGSTCRARRAVRSRYPFPS
jgi:hypothetical protein